MFPWLGMFIQLIRSSFSDPSMYVIYSAQINLFIFRRFRILERFELCGPKLQSVWCLEF